MFNIPSLRRELYEPPRPELDDGHEDLLTMVDVGPARDPEDGLADNIDRLLEVVEPVLILLSLCGREAVGLAIAGKDTLKAVSVSLDEPVKITGLESADWPSPITLGLIADPVVVAFQLSSRIGAIPSARFDDGWFVIRVPGASGSLALVDLLGHVRSAIPQAREELLDDVSEVVGTLSFSDLVAANDLPTGLLTMFDPDGWLVESLTVDQVDARDEDDPDAEALDALGDAGVGLIGSDFVEFLRTELERDDTEWEPLRSRFGEDRSARQLVRSGMRAARRRHRVVAREEGLRRAFRFGRSRRLTYTEFLIGCHIEEVLDALDRLDRTTAVPRWEFEQGVFGEAGQRYAIARLPSPTEAVSPFTAAVVNPGAAASALSLSCRRWGSDAELTGAGPLTLEDGQFALPIELVDGPQDWPVLSVETGLLASEINGTTDVLRISGIQHGDVIVLTDGATSASEQIAVVKNFSLNDLNRLRAHGYDVSIAPSFGDLGGLAATIADAVEFLLADGPDTEQDRQRTSLIGTTREPIPPSSEPKAAPATLDVPSARGIGTFPDDTSQLHVCLPQVHPADPDLTARVATLTAGADSTVDAIAVPELRPYHADPGFRDAIVAYASGIESDLAQIMTDVGAVTGSATVWNTYAAGAAARPLYQLAGSAESLWPGDPVRNVGAVRDATCVLVLVEPVDRSGGIEELDLRQVITTNLFVNRQAQAEFYVPAGQDLIPSVRETLQIADALASLADGGVVPTGVFTAGEPTDPVDPTEPTDPTDPFDPTDFLRGSIRFVVVDDAGQPLPLARIRVRGFEPTEVKSDLFGEAVLVEQLAGPGSAEVVGYPDHEVGRASYTIAEDTETRVQLELRRVSPPPGLPPLRGRIAESSGFFVRDRAGPTGGILAKLDYMPLDVTVLNAEEVTDKGPPIEDLWYRVRFDPGDFLHLVTNYEDQLDDADDADGLAAHQVALAFHQGVEGWVGGDALSTIAMSWDHFLGLLAEFEDDFDEDVLTQLSRIRQMGENSDVAGNDAAGAGHDVPNQESLADRSPDPERWSIVYEAKQVEFPDGEIIDIHHFLLGVESRVDDGRRSDDRIVWADLDSLPLPDWVPALPEGVPVPKDLPIGESYSALTWSGDVGAAVSDLLRHESDAWEEETAPNSAGDVLHFYFRTRAPDMDLLPDVDAWGAADLLPPYDGTELVTVDSLTELVTQVYGPAGPLTELHMFRREATRSTGVREMLIHYGFTTEEDLKLQSGPAAAMAEQVKIFAPTWFTVTAVKAFAAGKVGEVDDWALGPTDAELQQLNSISEQMTAVFLEWLDDLAEALMVTL